MGYEIKTLDQLHIPSWKKMVSGVRPYPFWFLPEVFRFFEQDYGQKALFLTIQVGRDFCCLPLLIHCFKRFGLSWQGVYIRYGPYCTTENPVVLQEFDHLYKKAFRELSFDYIIIGASSLNVASGHTQKPFIKELRTPWQTALIDLTIEEKVLWNKIERHAKKNIRRLQEHKDITISILEDASSIECLYTPLLEESRKRQGATMPRLYPCQTLLACLQGNPTTIVKVFLVSYHDQPIAAMGILGTQEGIFEVGMAQSLVDLHHRFYSHDLIKWEIMRWAKEQGIAVYDLCGFNPHPVNAKEEGIRRFKLKWGGQLYDYHVTRWHPFTLKAKSKDLLGKMRKGFHPF